MKERATFVEDIINEGRYLLESPDTYDETVIKKKWNDQAEDLMREWGNILNSIPDFNSQEIEHAFKAFLEEKSLGIGAVLPLFRLVLTGKGIGPSMFEIASFLGKEECIKRIETGIQHVNSHA